MNLFSETTRIAGSGLRSLMLSLAIAAAALAAASGTANAFDSPAECTAEVTKLVQDLLKANVSSEQVNSVYEAINQAEAACASSDFGAAQTAIDLGKQRLQDATAG